MTLAELRYRVRQLCGSPTTNEVPNADLDTWIQTSLAWFATECKWDFHTDEAIALTEDQREYPLPAQLAWIVFVEWDSKALEPTTTYAYGSKGSASGTSSTSWHTVASGTPNQYAVENRKLILLPPADSTALDTASFLAIRWIGAGVDSLANGGAPALSELDQDLVRWQAAIFWLASHPTEENQSRIQTYTALIRNLLPAAKRRWENPIETLYPGFSVSVDRWSGAR